MSNKNTFVAAADRINQIGLNQSRIDDLKGSAKEITAESQGLKLDTYCHLIAGISSAPLTSKANMNAKDRVALKKALMSAGQQTDSMADKLIKAVSGDDKKCKVTMVVEKIAGRRSTKKNEKGERVAGDKWLGGFTYAQIEEFHTALEDALRTRGKMEAAGQEAGDQTDQDNADVNEMLEKL